MNKLNNKISRTDLIMRNYCFKETEERIKAKNTVACSVSTALGYLWEASFNFFLFVSIFVLYVCVFEHNTAVSLANPPYIFSKELQKS